MFLASNKPIFSTMHLSVSSSTYFGVDGWEGGRGGGGGGVERELRISNFAFILLSSL